MARFSSLEFDAESGTVTMGTGLTWDQVYSRLEPLGVMVVGGRVIGVGKHFLLFILLSSMPFNGRLGLPDRFSPNLLTCIYILRAKSGRGREHERRRASI